MCFDASDTMEQFGLEVLGWTGGFGLVPTPPAEVILTETLNPKLFWQHVAPQQERCHWLDWSAVYTVEYGLREVKLQLIHPLKLMILVQSSLNPDTG